MAGEMSDDGEWSGECQLCLEGHHGVLRADGRCECCSAMVKPRHLSLVKGAKRGRA